MSTDPAPVVPVEGQLVLPLPLRWTWDSDAQHVFRRCLECGAEVWAFREGLVCSGCSADSDHES